MAILATKEETATHTTLEIEVPAEDVEKAFAAVTKSYVQRATAKDWRTQPCDAGYAGTSANS